MASRLKKNPQAPLPEPDLLPMMNITFLLIVAVMSMTAFVHLASITSESPKLSSKGKASSAPKEDKKEVNFTVFLTETGVEAQVYGQKLKADNGGTNLIPKKEGNYDWTAVERLAAKIKEAHPEESQVMIGADPDVTFESIVNLLDHVRESFPFPVFVAGVTN